MKLIAFKTNIYTKDEGFWVDDEDYERVNKFKWHLEQTRDRKISGTYYKVVRNATVEEKRAGSPNKITAHRFILNMHLRYAMPNEEIDHVSRNTLDNRKSNLRVCTRQQNQRNKGNATNVGDGLWGATFIKNKTSKPWKSNFHKLKKTYNIGYFDTEIEAHEAAKLALEQIGK